MFMSFNQSQENYDEFFEACLDGRDYMSERDIHDLPWDDYVKWMRSLIQRGDLNEAYKSLTYFHMEGDDEFFVNGGILFDNQELIEPESKQKVWDLMQLPERELRQLKEKAKDEGDEVNCKLIYYALTLMGESELYPDDPNLTPLLSLDDEAFLEAYKKLSSLEQSCLRNLLDERRLHLVYAADREMRSASDEAAQEHMTEAKHNDNA